MIYQKQNFADGQILKAEHLNHMEDGIANAYAAGKDGADCHTELARNGSLVTVICKGLTVGEQYAVHLYTASRRRGGRHAPWRHPSNENTGAGYTGKGYANLAGKKYGESTTIFYPAVPEWMPNNGILQTEWSFTAAAETEKLEIDLRAWLLPMLKPYNVNFGPDAYGLIGVANDCIAPLLMQWRMVKDGIVCRCSNTLRVGIRAEGVGAERKTGTILGVSTSPIPLIDASYIYASIQ